MKFITEDDLRDLYRKEPFTKYDLGPGERLTPGARQYLMDKGINMFDDGPYVNKPVTSVKPQVAAPEKSCTWKKKKIHCRLRSTQALFLQTSEELLSGDATVGESLLELSKQFASVVSEIEGKGKAEDLCCDECTGIKADNFSLDIDDCFEITEEHLQLKKGRDIVILHRLRCMVREIEPTLLEIYEGTSEENTVCKEAIGKINQIVNTLNRMICSVAGGKVCMRNC
jgi:ethanolamine utilization cobalamin adenosyltransferase